MNDIMMTYLIGAAVCAGGVLWMILFHWIWYKVTGDKLWRGPEPFSFLFLPWLAAAVTGALLALPWLVGSLFK